MLLIILLNAITFAVYDSSLQNKELNKVCDKLSYVFTAFYIIEATVKIISDGFVLGKGTYVRNPINCFDLVIITCAISEILMNLLTKPSKTVS